MAEQDDNRSTASQESVNGVEVFRFQVLLDFFRRHRAYLDAAKQIGGGALKMALPDPTKFFLRFFFGERDVEIAQRKAAIFGENPPRPSSHELAQAEKKGQWQRARYCRPGTIEEIDAEIEHSGAARWGRSGRAEA